MNATECLEEFTSQWDIFSKAGYVNFNEFEDYYWDVSATIDRDDYFEELIQNNWADPEGTVTFKKSVYKHFEIGADGKQKETTGGHLKKL